MASGARYLSHYVSIGLAGSRKPIAGNGRKPGRPNVLASRLFWDRVPDRAATHSISCSPSTTPKPEGWLSPKRLVRDEAAPFGATLQAFIPLDVAAGLLEPLVGL